MCVGVFQTNYLWRSDHFISERIYIFTLELQYFIYKHFIEINLQYL